MQYLQGLNPPRAQTTQMPVADKQASCSHAITPFEQRATATLAAALVSAFPLRPPARKQTGVLLWCIAMKSTGKIEEEKNNRPQPILESYARREVHNELFPQQRLQLRLQNLSNHAGTLPWGLLGSLFPSKSAERWHGKDPALLPQLAGRESCLGKARTLQPSLPALSEFTGWNAMRIHGCVVPHWVWVWAQLPMWFMLVSGLVLKFKHLFFHACPSLPPFFPNLSFTTLQKNGSLQTQARGGPI